MADTKRIAEQLVEEGLQLYNQGRLDEGMSLWLRALAHDPHDERARQYLRYVEENRVALEQSFAYVRATTGPSWPSVSRAMPVAHSARPQDDNAPLPSGQAEQVRQRRAAVGRSRTPSAELLSAMNWDTLRTPGRGSRGRSDDGAARGPSTAAQTSDMDLATLFRPRILSDEDRTPRIDALSGRASYPGATSEAQARPQPPRRPQAGGLETARARTETDFDGPEQSTGRFGELDTSVEIRARAPSLYSSGDLERVVAPKPSEVAPRRVKATETPPPKTAFEDLLRDRVQRLVDPVAADEGVVELPRAGLGVKEAASPHEELDWGDVELEAEVEAEDVVDDAAALVARFDCLSDQETRARTEEMLAGARRIFRQGSCESALWLAERVLRVDPSNTGALEVRAEAQAVLLESYCERLKDLDQVPVVSMPQEQILWHKLDHRAGFLLSRVDGVLSLGDILDISGMTLFEAYRILVQLLDEGVIGFQS